jgi:signal peptide peptidase SppA
MIDFNQPWAMLPESFRALHEQARTVKALQARDAVPLDGTAGVKMRGDVACLYVKGVLARYHDWLLDFLGGCSYGEIMKDLTRVLENPAAKSVLFVVNSPGGVVDGVAELAAAIYAARGKKPMAAYVGGTGASAAYFLTAAAGKIYCASTAVVGSIGVITSLVDETGALADAGLKEFELVSSQSPNKSQRPADASYRARVQQRIDDMAQVFVNDVAKYRGVRPQTVIDKYGAGDVMVGQRAVDAGLADEISDVETVIARLQKQAEQSRNVFTMPSSKAAVSTGNGKGQAMAAITTPSNDIYSGRDQCAQCQCSLSKGDIRFGEECRRSRDSDTAARDAGLDSTRFCSGCARKLDKDDTVYCASDATKNTPKGSMTMKTEKRRAKLGMSMSASAADVKAAWKSRKAAKRAVKATALGLPATATSAQIKATKAAAKAAVPAAPASATPKVWNGKEGRYFTADEVAVMTSSANVQEVAEKLRNLRAKGGQS